MVGSALQRKDQKNFFLFDKKFFYCLRRVAYRRDTFVIEYRYLDEIEAEFQNTLACFSGAKRGSNHQKTEGRKSHDTLPLMGEAFEAL